MKRFVSLLLALAMVLCLFAGCGSSGTETEPETVALTTVEPATEPTTEPILSPEEQLLASLPEQMLEAYEVGLVELEQLEDLNCIVTVGEASAMLQKAYVHRTGVESKTLNEMMSREEYASRNAPRGWLMGMPGLADLELTHGEKFENYEQWVKHTGDNGGWTELWGAFDNRFGAKGIIPMEIGDNGHRYNADGDTVFADNFCSLPMAALDFWEYDAVTGPNGTDMLYHSLPEIVAYAFKIFDGTNGKKFMELEDGDIDPYREITVGEMVEHALVYYNYPNPMEYPEFVAAEDVGTYNTDIITEDLLTRETDLPEASCEHLPAEWHGVIMDDMELLTSDIHLDDNIYEYEIQAVKDAGFNYIGLNLDFNWLQDYLLFDSSSSASSTFQSIRQKEDAGKLSVQRLEQLDQVLAWCMEYDIHVNLRATGLGYNTNSHEQNMSIVANYKGVDAKLAKLWQAIARRYADIPNTYLSFTVLTGFDTLKADTLMPAIEAIQEVSPERCIIVEIYGWGHLTAEPFAEKGVALSFKLEEPSAVLNHGEYFDMTAMNEVGLTDSTVIDSFTWPYEGVDAETALATRRYNKAESCLDVIAVAEEYGVGFMLSNFGVELSSTENTLLPRTRYADEDYKAMIVDITSAMEELGYGWCFANWYGYYGIAAPMTIVKDATYEQVEDFPYYIDQTMYGWFREINGVN